MFLDTDGFYDGLRTQLRRMEQDGFLPAELDSLVRFAADGAEVLSYLEGPAD